MRPFLLLLGVFICAGGPTLFASSIDATATYTDSEISPGEFQYDLTLNNTGTTTIGTFWFSWVITPNGANGFLPDTPTNVVDPTGWTDILTNGGAAIQFKTSSNLLASGNSLSGFQFDSTMTPAQLQMDFAGSGVGDGDPIATSFVYAGAPLVGSSDQFVPTAATAATPEPATTLIVAIGFGLIVLTSSSIRKHKKYLES
jgi:hypothetical protein